MKFFIQPKLCRGCRSCVVECVECVVVVGARNAMTTRGQNTTVKKSVRKCLIKIFHASFDEKLGGDLDAGQLPRLGKLIFHFKLVEVYFYEGIDFVELQKCVIDVKYVTPVSRELLLPYY